MKFKDIIFLVTIGLCFGLTISFFDNEYQNTMLGCLFLIWAINAIKIFEYNRKEKADIERIKKIKYLSLYSVALEIATKAHAKQKDRGGEPYIFHCLKVASECELLQEKIVAILHDTVEDTEITLKYLKEKGFDDELLTAIQLLTKTEADKTDEGYKEYLARIKNNEIAKNVKIADLEHNSDISRIPNPNAKDYERQKKYEESISFLKE